MVNRFAVAITMMLGAIATIGAPIAQDYRAQGQSPSAACPVLRN